MKKYALILAATLALSGTAFAGVPVTVIADVPAITNQIETMAKWKAQYDQMVSQINQMQKQYDAVTGPRGLGQIMNNPALRDYLPSDWQKVYDSVRTGGYNGLSGSAAAIHDANKVFDACGAAHRVRSRSGEACAGQGVRRRGVCRREISSGSNQLAHGPDQPDARPEGDRRAARTHRVRASHDRQRADQAPVVPDDGAG